ncbi:MAG: hypothetical protein HKN03_07335 [Acidimicrobiales bacterium]|nr:hypothetical protein [Acidimicrobiales bacterium]
MLNHRIPLQLVVVTLAVATIAAACGAAVVDVQTGSYSALVPTAEQLDTGAGQTLPGGFGSLRDAGIETIEVRVAEAEVTILLDGAETVTRRITDRVRITDAEGSGPFKAQKEVLVLDSGPLVLGELTIMEPVLWPGSFEESPIATLKEWDPDERGPGVSCGPDESCLLLTSSVSPIGSYEDSNNPELGQNPISTIEVTEATIEFFLDDGKVVTVETTGSRSTTQSCGLAETSVWDVPREIGLPLDDPVLIHTVCPSTPGEPIQLVIMERREIPLMAPFDTTADGSWCPASSTCLWFAPI